MTKKVRKKFVSLFLFQIIKKENRPQSCFLKFGLAAVIITVNSPNQRFTILPLGIKTGDISHKLSLKVGLSVGQVFHVTIDSSAYSKYQPKVGGQKYETSRPFPRSGKSYRLPTLFGSQATIVRTISQYRNRITPNINIVGKGCFQENVPLRITDKRFAHRPNCLT